MGRMARRNLIAFGVLVMMAASLGAAAAAPAAGVTLMHVPDGGIQPQVAVDAGGRAHLLYYKGPDDAGDLFYTTSADGKTFGRPLRVNDLPGSAIAIGTVRGAHLALGKDGRAHVAWMGSRAATLKAGTKETPLLYARTNDAGDAFEPQRNIIGAHPGLDGGPSVAADGAGGVYVAWHAPERPGAGEEGRRVYMAASADEGKTFKPEAAINPDPTGCCACCGLRIFATPGGTVLALYRGATDKTQRDNYLLTSRKGAAFEAAKRQEWPANQCVMSTAAMAPAAGGNGVLAAWETKGQVYWARIDDATGKTSAFVPGPGQAKNRKHPAIAANGQGLVLMAWAEGTGWQRGGSVAWQVYGSDGAPAPNAAGRAAGLPAWDLPAAFARPDGSFVVLY